MVFRVVRLHWHRDLAKAILVRRIDVERGPELFHLDLVACLPLVVRPGNARPPHARPVYQKHKAGNDEKGLAWGRLAAHRSSIKASPRQTKKTVDLAVIVIREEGPDKKEKVHTNRRQDQINANNEAESRLELVRRAKARCGEAQ